MSDSENLAIPRRIIDTNIIIRYLVGDGEDHAIKARQLFKNATDEKVVLVIPEIVFIEAVHVLRSHYKTDRGDIANALRNLIRLPGVETMTPVNVLNKGLDNFETINVPWPDALIAALVSEEDMAVYSFDGHFDKFPDVERLIP